MKSKPIIRSKLVVPRLVRYGLVGLTNTATDFGIFSILYFLIHLDAVWANTFAFAIAVTQSYLFNGVWTFQLTKQQWSLRAYLRFVLINLGGLMISTVCIVSLSELIPALVAKLLAAGVVLIWGFFLSRQFVFQTPTGTQTLRAPRGKTLTG